MTAMVAKGHFLILACMMTLGTSNMDAGNCLLAKKSTRSYLDKLELVEDDTEIALSEANALVLSIAKQQQAPLDTPGLTDEMPMNTTAALRVVSSLLVTLGRDTTTWHFSDQADIDTMVTLVEDCGGNDSTLGDGARQAQKGFHETCRTIQANAYDKAKNFCSAYYAVKKGAPSCPLQIQPARIPDLVDAQGRLPDLVACYHEYKKYMEDVEAPYLRCTAAVGKKLNATERCISLQSSFEEASCAAREQTGTYCACRVEHAAAYERRKANVTANEAIRKTRFRTIVHLMCHIRALQKSIVAERQKALDACLGMSVDVTNFTIDVKPLPAALTTCSTTQDGGAAVCTAAWRANAYANKAWSSRAPAGTCTPCTGTNQTVH